MGLQAFYAQNSVFISEQDAYQILVWFFGGNAGVSPAQLTLNDRSFAQALIFEAIMKSKEVWAVEGLFRDTSDPTSDILETLKTLATYWIGSGLLWNRLKPSDLKNPTIYDMVKDTLTRNWRSKWKIRTIDDNPVY